MGRQLDERRLAHWVRSSWTAHDLALRAAVFAEQKFRVGGSAETSVLVNSLPKSGTHLAVKAITALGGHRRSRRHLGASALSPSQALPRLAPGWVATGHLPFGRPLAEMCRTHGITVVFIVRDLRAVVASHVRYVTGLPRHRLHAHYDGLQTVEEQLVASICGVTDGGDELLRPLSYRLANYRPWIDAADVTVRFEDLVGPRGGGALDAQVETLDELATAVRVVPDRPVREVAHDLFDTSSPTFRGGRVDSWQAMWSSRVEEVMQAEIGPELTAWGTAQTVEV